MALSLRNTHAKLLAFDFNSLTRSSPFSFSRKGVRIFRVEVLGVLVSAESNPDKFLKFIIDDGTGCISCILWLNHFTSSYFARRKPVDVQAMADVARMCAEEVKVGAVVRVRGKVGSYRCQIQVTVADIVGESDPNAETLHWLQCIRLAHVCYDVGSSSRR